MKNFIFPDPVNITEKAKKLYQEERQTQKVLNGWFLSRKFATETQRTTTETFPELCAAQELEAIVTQLPISISEYALLAGTQRDAFAASYALINPTFKVENFHGYCDPLEVYDYVTPTENISSSDISSLKNYMASTSCVKKLNKIYENNHKYTDEVAFFIEQVTGHMIPDFRFALKYGLRELSSTIEKKLFSESNTLSEEQKKNLTAMLHTLHCAVVLAHRYADLAAEQQKTASPSRTIELKKMEENLRHVPEFGARSLWEALQSFVILWEVMCLEQAPNPFAFSVGNADRIFEPYRAMDNLSREESAALFKHFLVYFNVGERSWAISQNILLSGRDLVGTDLTSPMTYAILDAYYDMNLPQPILSVKLHQNTPSELYKELGRFLFTPGCLTPSFFNDDSLFETLHEHGIEQEDLPDYAVAGCQEPLIMGKDNGNTTNSWLNLGKILELTLSGGTSTITGKTIGPETHYTPEYLLEHIQELFYKNVAFFANKMAIAANEATAALSELPIPFLSCFMGGIKTGYDTRDIHHQGTKYNGSGCLIHGLSVVADSFVAIRHLLNERPDDAQNLILACASDFNGYDELLKYLKSCPKYGNNQPEVDQIASEIVQNVSEIVRNQKNLLGNPFRPDWSTPSTHLLYGYWVGATPDGRRSREMLNYGIDPLFGTAENGLGFRTISMFELPYSQMNGGCASHFGIDPKYFTSTTYEEKGLQFYQKILKSLFFNKNNKKRAPFYLYVNVTTADTLRAVLKEPKKYAPSGVYIMRIHGTFVNFLDLSPAIQQDIITRLDPASTCC